MAKKDVEEKKEKQAEEKKPEAREVKTEVKEVRTEAKEVKTEVKEVKTEVKEVKTEVKEVKTEVKKVKTEAKEVKKPIEKTVEKVVEKKDKVECNDNFCPSHGKTKLHGRSLIGEVISTKSHKTATIVRERQHFLRKYERYEKRRTKIQVHNPPCINAKVGDIVKVVESRPLSKTKNFIVVEVLEKK